MKIRSQRTARAVVALVPVACLGAGAPALAGGPALTAEYELVFRATWSAESHPEDFPSGAHFSPLIGGTHTDAVAFWAEGAIASAGMEFMAETGSKTVLRNEVLAQITAGEAESVIEGFVVLSSPGTTTLTFSLSQDFPLATVVTMIAPSPDWFVGTAGLPLFTEGRWLPEVVFPLLPYDAGTDSGITYRSTNQNTNPPDPIAEILGYPFAADGDRSTPLGTYTFRRINAPACRGDVSNSGHVSFEDLLVVLGDWGPCEGCPGDINGDGAADFVDILIVLEEWGACG